MTFDAKRYKPAGPTLARFHASDKFFRMVGGPIGSGKTVACGVAEPVFTGMLQRPYPDGRRKAKVGTLRDTYRNLYATTMKTWLDWIPKDIGRFTGSDDRPALHAFSLDTPVGPIDLDVEWRALGANTVEAVCRGWELNGAGIDEADLVPREAMSFLAGRVTRGGEKAYRRSRGVWMSLNKPDVDHWTYDVAVDNPPENFEFFDQPGGILPGGPPFLTNPAAENLANLDDDYYQLAATGQPDWYIRRMVRNQWGASISGEVIYQSFRPEVHISPVELEPEPGQTLVLGLDGGGTPAAVIMGHNRQGQRVVYAEVVLYDPTDPRGQRLRTAVGARRFAQAIKEVLRQRFPRCPVRIAYGDPAAFYGADQEMGEFSFMETVGLELEIGIVPAPSNEISLRHQAVNGLLEDFPYGQPAILFNPSLKMTRRGFNADYKWEKVDPKQPGKPIKPQKTVSSHVHDALQYVCLGDVGRAGVTSGRAFDRFQPKAQPLMIETSPGHFRPWDRPTMPVEVAGTHYRVEFDVWGS